MTPGHGSTTRRGLAASLLTLAAALPTSSWAADDVVLLHTTDTHGQLFPTDPPEDAGGAARRATLIRRQRAAAEADGDHVLLLDAGDINTGTYESDRTRGLLDVAVMNAMGYDAAAVGNHEFDLLPAELEAFERAAAFPLLSANVRGRSLGREFRPFVVLEAGPRRVGVVGLTTPTTPSTSTHGRRYPLRFRDPGEELARALAQLERQEEVDAVVVLSHLGDMPDRLLLERFAGRFDAWIGGHTDPEVVTSLGGGAAYTRAGSRGRWLGRVRLAFPADGGRSVAEADLLPVTAALPRDPAITRLLPTPEREPPVGKLTAPLERRPAPGAAQRSSALGNLFADALRRGGAVDVAVVNRGGLRRGLPAGALRAKQLYGVCPFRNTLLRYRLDGRQLQAVFDQAAQLGRGGNGFLEVSGAQVVGEGGRARVRVGGRPLRPSGRYTLGVSDFLAGGGDGYTVFADLGEAEVVDETPAAMLEAHVRALGVVRPDPTARVRLEPPGRD